MPCLLKPGNRTITDSLYSYHDLVVCFAQRSVVVETPHWWKQSPRPCVTFNVLFCHTKCYSSITFADLVPSPVIEGAHLAPMVIIIAFHQSLPSFFSIHPIPSHQQFRSCCHISMSQASTTSMSSLDMEDCVSSSELQVFRWTSINNTTGESCANDQRLLWLVMQLLFFRDFRRLFWSAPNGEWHKVKVEASFFCFNSTFPSFLLMTAILSWPLACSHHGAPGRK